MFYWLFVGGCTKPFPAPVPAHTRSNEVDGLEDELQLQLCLAHALVFDVILELDE